MQQEMEPFRRIQAQHKVDDACLDRALSDIWRDLLRDPAVTGNPEYVVLTAKQHSPFTAGREEAQSGIALTIAISIASGLATAALKSVAIQVWEKFFWPELERRFGADIEELADDKDS